jgi:hypothetical protein
MGDMGNADSNGFTLYTNETSFYFDYGVGNGSIFDQVIQDQYTLLRLNNQLSYLNEQGIDEGQTRSTQHFNDESESSLVSADVGNDEPSYPTLLDAFLQGQNEPNQPMGNNEAWKRLLSEPQDTGVESKQVMSPQVMSPTRIFNHPLATITSSSRAIDFDMTSITDFDQGQSDNQSSDPQVQVIDEVEQPMQPTRIFNDLPITMTMAPKPPHGRPRTIKPSIVLTPESMDDDNVKETKKRRGRKPIDTCPTTSAPTTTASTSNLSIGKKTKRQKMLEEAAEKNEAVVCFGNQVVPKETPEYVAKRVKNNEAVKKSRAKKAQENLERDEKMPELHKENDTLKANLDSLVKEINEIKDNILLLNRGRNLPDDISRLFRQFDEECKRWLKF